MVCRNRGIYGFLGTSWVLITIYIAYIISPPRNGYHSVRKYRYSLYIIIEYKHPSFFGTERYISDTPKSDTPTKKVIPYQENDAFWNGTPVFGKMDSALIPCNLSPQNRTPVL